MELHGAAFTSSKPPLSRTDREDLEVLDLLMVAQGEHKRLGITLTVPQQE